MNTTSRNLLVGATAVGVLAVTVCGAWALWRSEGLPAAARRRSRKQDLKRDEALEQSFPASDPPATQDFDIPANRA
jgi:hypothetical protein